MDTQRLIQDMSSSKLRPNVVDRCVKLAAHDPQQWNEIKGAALAQMETDPLGAGGLPDLRQWLGDVEVQAGEERGASQGEEREPEPHTREEVEPEIKKKLSELSETLKWMREVERGATEGLIKGFEQEDLERMRARVAQAFRIHRSLGQDGEALTEAGNLEDRYEARGCDFFGEDNKPGARRQLLSAPRIDAEAQEMGTPYLALGKVGLLVSPGGVGKTALLCQLALSVTTGLPWMGYNVESPGKVLLALGEEDAEEVQRRVWNAGQMLGLAPGMTNQDRAVRATGRLHSVALAGKLVPLVPLDGEGESEFALELEDYLEDHAGEDGWQLIVLDPGSRFMGIENENDNAQATRFIQAVERLTKMPGNPTVIVAHHTSKSSMGGQGAARGASAFVDGARWMSTLTRLKLPSGWEDGEVTAANELALVKSNYGPLMPPVIVLRKKHGWEALPPEQAASFREASKEEQAKEVAKAKLIKKSAEDRALDELKATVRTTEDDKSSDIPSKTQALVSACHDMDKY